MSASHFRAPGEEFLHPPTATRDALLVRRGGGGHPRPKPKEVAPEPPVGEPEEGQPTGKKAEVRLSGPAFAIAEAYFHDKVKATVKAEFPDPDAARHVMLEVWAVSPEGDRERIHGADRPVGKDGTAHGEFTLFQPKFKDAAGAYLDACDFVLVASHPEANQVESAPIKAKRDPNRPFDGLVLYSPLREEYLIFETEEEAQPLLMESKQIEDLRARIHQAWENPDPSKRMKTQEKLEEEALELFGGKSLGNARKGVEELLTVDDRFKKGRFKGWYYIPDPTGEGRQPWKYGEKRFKRAEAQNAYDKLLKRSKGKAKSVLDGKLKANLVKTQPKSDQLWAPEWANDKGGSGDSRFNWSREAAFMRYMVGWDGGEISFDPKKKILKVGASGQASGSLFEGRLQGTFEIPGPKGVNILGCLQSVKYGDQYLVDPTRSCWMKICIQGQVSAFVGATIQGAVAFPSLCFEGQGDGKQKSELSATGSAFAGGQLRAGATASVKWSVSKDLPFESLGSIGYEYGISAGAGAEVGLKVAYADGKFIFQFSAAVAWMLGAKGGFNYEVSAVEGWKLLGHILDCVDFHFVKEIGKDAYETYVKYSSLMALHEQQRARFQMEMAQAQGEWLFETLRDWLLNRNAEFLLAKMNLKDKVGARSTLTKMAPEALGLALALIMKTREDSDFDAIMLILHSTTSRKDSPAGKSSPDHKLKWVLRYISSRPKFDGPDKEHVISVALKAGMEKLREFGMGIGYKNNSGKKLNFLERLESLFTEHELSGK